ncbi:winged helix-turn-helix domain-containing protein [Sneathiella sp.]|uniref:winged helix-turn-helix domain-containing protein n=1 Tax=Sneathiella sp. TaxID=1964365 RepID=UPI00342603A9
MELRRRGSVIPIEPQVFSLLELLITQHNRFVSKDEINEIVWGGRSVSDSA